MEKEISPEVIKATQTSLGKYVKRPPLTEKLLKKPPFRFLHDIVTSVLKTNGFFEGLFEEKELVSDNVKDRDSKIAFLNKVISVIALTTGNNLSVKPSKIVAGQEPEKTNELLQSLAYALDQKLTSEDAVKKYKEDSKAPRATEVKSKEKDTKPVKKSNDAKKLTSRSNEKLTTVKKESPPVNKNEKSKTSDQKSKRKDTSKNDQQIKKSQNLKNVGKKESTESIIQPSSTNDFSNRELQEKNVILSQKELNQNEEIKCIHEDKSLLKTQEEIVDTELSAQLNAVKIDQEVQGKLNSSYTIAENELNSSLSSQDLMDIDNDKIDEKFIEKSVQESAEVSADGHTTSTQKEPVLTIKEEVDDTLSTKKLTPVLIPKHNSFDSEIKPKTLLRNNSQDNPVKAQTPDIVRPPSVRPSSSRPGAPRLREKNDNVIPENDNLILGKVNIIAENAQNDEEEESSVFILEQHGIGSDTADSQQEAVELSSNGHGHLVQQILNSQKELSNISGKTEIEWQFGAQKIKEASSQEIEQLRFNIQALSRVANPLGKLLDHIQEDVEVMRQELLQWTNIYEEVSNNMLKQKGANEKTLVPLQTRVKQLDMDIEEKRDRINDIKILIHKNTARIQKLLDNGNVQ